MDKNLIILLHEIYGVNDHIHSVAQYYRNLGYEVYCPDYLKLAEPFRYDQQEEAYHNFITNVGFKKASDYLTRIAWDAHEKYKCVFAFGFSIGATLAWILSDESNLLEGVVGFYGSRIRDYTGIQPKCPVLLLYGSEEKSFDVKSYYGLLNKHNVEMHMLEGAHGFADPFSPNYYKNSCDKSLILVNDFMKKITTY